MKILKTFTFLIIFFLMIFTCGFSIHREKPYVILSSASIVYSGNAPRAERCFYSGQRIFYNLVAPDGFKYNGVRFKVTKHDEKTSNWGYSVLSSKDLYLDSGIKNYQDYFIANKKGHYIVEFYYLNNLDYPFARNEFWVK